MTRIKVPAPLVAELEAMEADPFETDGVEVAPGQAAFVRAFRAARRERAGFVIVLGPAALAYLRDHAMPNMADVHDDQGDRKLLRLDREFLGTLRSVRTQPSEVAATTPGSVRTQPPCDWCGRQLPPPAGGKGGRPRVSHDECRAVKSALSLLTKAVDAQTAAGLAPLDGSPGAVPLTHTRKVRQRHNPETTER